MSEKAMQGDIVDRLRGRYPCGPRLPNGDPEFGWREFDPDTLAHLLKKPSGIMLEAANEIERLRKVAAAVYSNWACGEPVDEDMEELGKMLGLKVDVP